MTLQDTSSKVIPISSGKATVCSRGSMNPSLEAYESQIS